LADIEVLPSITGPSVGTGTQPVPIGYHHLPSTGVPIEEYLRGASSSLVGTHMGGRREPLAGRQDPRPCSTLKVCLCVPMYVYEYTYIGIVLCIPMCVYVYVYVYVPMCVYGVWYIEVCTYVAVGVWIAVLSTTY